MGRVTITLDSDDYIIIRKKKKVEKEMTIEEIEKKQKELQERFEKLLNESTPAERELCKFVYSIFQRSHLSL